MTYDIVFVEKQEQLIGGRAVGEQLFLSGLPTSPKVFALFYCGSRDSSEVETLLRTLGQKTGNNLFVNIASHADPDYDRAAKLFNITRWPVIVVTAISPLAATPEGDNAFIRLDNKSLFERPDELVQTVEKLFNLFLADDIGRAVRTGWIRQERAALFAAAERIWSVIQPVIVWIAKKDLALEFLGAKIEIKECGRQ
jgi:hypothetical protein